MFEFPKQLTDCEKILSDRFTDYLIVAIDGEFVYNKCSSNTAAMGMCEYMRNQVYRNWNAAPREDF